MDSVILLVLSSELIKIFQQKSVPYYLPKRDSRVWVFLCYHNAGLANAIAKALL